jgi:hypothetical protein
VVRYAEQASGVEFQLGMENIGLCLETLIWLSLDVFLFLVLLNGAVPVGVLCLIVRCVCVCVCGGCGDECRVGRSVVAWGNRIKDI